MSRVYLEAESVAWTCLNLHCLKSYDIIKFLWHHSFFSNMTFNKSMLQILHLNGLYPLALVSLEEDVSSESFYGSCILVTWLTKYGHDYRKWRQPPIEQTWSKTKPRIMREPKMWLLEVIHSNHFVVEGLPPLSGVHTWYLALMPGHQHKMVSVQFKYMCTYSKWVHAQYCKIVS